jgi:hypothetical protein
MFLQSQIIPKIICAIIQINTIKPANILKINCNSSLKSFKIKLISISRTIIAKGKIYIDIENVICLNLGSKFPL